MGWLLCLLCLVREWHVRPLVWLWLYLAAALCVQAERSELLELGRDSTIGHALLAAQEEKVVFSLQS